MGRYVPGFSRVRIGTQAGRRHMGLLDYKIGDGLFLPDRIALRKVAESAAKKGVQVMDARAVTGRRADEPIQGRGAVMPRDERDAKYGRPGIYFDFTGEVPIIKPGDGRALEDLKDEVDEHKHYGLDRMEQERAERAAAKDPMNWMAAFLLWEEIVKRKRAGRRTYGALATGRTR